MQTTSRLTRNILALPLCLWLSAACQPQSGSSLQDGWDQVNDPAIMGTSRLTRTYDYVDTLADLPLSAQLSREIWSGDYWPSRFGGLAFRWNSPVVKDPPPTSEGGGSRDVVRFKEAIDYRIEPVSKIPLDAKTDHLSPLEKYDLFVGDENFTRTKTELERTGVLRTIPGSSRYVPSATIPPWEGLCHAWAPATISFDPVDAVTLTGASGHSITFGAADVQALLIYFIQRNSSLKRDFLGGRSLERPADLARLVADGQPVPPECRDINPGSFHLVLANQIGLRDEGFIADVEKSQEVWNQGVVGYQSKMEDVSQSVPPSAAPETVSRALVKTKMFYISEVSSVFKGKPKSNPFSHVVLRYWLELNKDGKIIGGEWASINQDHPDFLWKYQTKPEFRGSYAPLKQIYEAAAKAYKEAGYKVDRPFTPFSPGAW